MLGSSRRGKKTGTRKINRPKPMKGGMGYGMSGTIGTAGALYTPSWGGEITKSGEPVYDTADRPAVGGRRRKSKKAKKSRRRKTMRGGASWRSIAPAGGSFTGEGSRGLANLTGYSSKVPPEGGPAQNPDGAYRA